MRKQIEIIPRLEVWEVCHNHVPFRVCRRKRDAIRVALTLGRMQLRLGDDAEIILRDHDGEPRARRGFSALNASQTAPIARH